MAYMSQEKKKNIEPGVKQWLKAFGIKGSLSVNHHSTLVLTLASGKLDFLANYVAKTGREAGGYIQVNEYYLHDQFTGNCLALLEKLKSLMMDGNHDNSDSQTDYFDVGWYIDINVGRWNKPYTTT